MVNDRLGRAAIAASSPSRSSSAGRGCVVVMRGDTAGFNAGGCLDSAGLRVAASEAGHEGWLGGSGLDHVVASGMHIDCLLWGGV